MFVIIHASKKTINIKETVMTALNVIKVAKVNYTTLWTHPTPAKIDLCSLAIEVCEFAMKNMFNHINSNKTIQVLLDLPSKIDTDGTTPLGCCTNNANEGVIPGIVTIHVSPYQKHEEFINTLFHELTHALQIFEGRLSSSRIRHGDNPTIRLWNKRAFSTRLIAYEEWPWEVEARYEADRMFDLMDTKQAIANAIVLAQPKVIVAVPA